jgi:hypothetical protein
MGYEKLNKKCILMAWKQNKSKINNSDLKKYEIENTFPESSLRYGTAAS